MLSFNYYSLQLIKLNRKFDKLLGIILDSNLGDKLPNKNIFKLLFFFFVFLILLLKSQDKSVIAFFVQKFNAFDFDNYKKLFLLII